MTKRLQVLFEDEELAQIREIARRRRQTVAGWVRDVLRRAAQETTYAEVEPKLRAVREAAAHDFPVADIDQLLDEIERGYATGPAE
jgi:predicted 2-oxoglutarate/Fe(II)-dependent dioxygenase YbiX